MTVILPRSAWTSSGPHVPLTALVASEVLGVAIHWPGTTGPIGDPGQKSIAARLEGYRQYHTADPPKGHGWNDIAYNAAVDQAGRIWTLRGFDKESAANGDQTVNKEYVAILAMVGPGETPTSALIAAIVAARAEVLKLFPKATVVKGHKDVRPSPTDCPGPALEALIKKGAFSQTVVITPPKRPVPPSVGRSYLLHRTLRRGMVGEDVHALQVKLGIRADGDFGPVTLAAVKAFQRRKWPLLPLRWDGVVGPLTAVALGWTYQG